MCPGHYGENTDMVASCTVKYFLIRVTHLLGESKLILVPSKGISILQEIVVITYGMQTLLLISD